MATPQPSRTRRPKFQEIGATGLRLWGGRIYEEWLPELMGERGRRVIKEMAEQDPTIGGILFAIENLVRQTQWTFAPRDETEKAVEIAEFAQQCLDDMQPHWPDTLSEILSMLPYGWSWFEIVYKYRSGPQDDPALTSNWDDGKIGWRTWAIRSQDTLLRWETDAHDRVTALVQNAPPRFDILTVPLSKSLHFRTKARKDNPEGVSVLRSAYRPWYFKKHIEQIEGIGIERDLAGLPVMWVPPDLLSPNATDDQKILLAELQKIVTNIRRDEQEGVIMPLAYDESGKKAYELQLLSTGGQRQFDTGRVIDRYDQRMAMTLLADFILLGHEQVGSFALADSKTALFATALGAWLDSIATTINRFEMPRLLKLNGYDPSLVPTLSHSDIENADLGKLGTYLQSLASAGMTLFPNPSMEKHLLEQAGIPVPEEMPSQTEAMVQQSLQELGLVDEMGNPIPEEPPPDEGAPSTNGSTPATLRARNRTSAAGAAEAAGKPMRTPKGFAASEDGNETEQFFNPFHSKQSGRFDFNPMGTSTIVGGSLVKQFGGQAAAIRELHNRGKKPAEIARLLGVRPQAVHGQIAKVRQKAVAQAAAPGGIGHPNARPPQWPLKPPQGLGPAPAPARVAARPFASKGKPISKGGRLVPTRELGPTVQGKLAGQHLERAGTQTRRGSTNDVQRVRVFKTSHGGQASVNVTSAGGAQGGGVRHGTAHGKVPSDQVVRGLRERDIAAVNARAAGTATMKRVQIMPPGANLPGQGVAQAAAGRRLARKAQAGQAKVQAQDDINRVVARKADTATLKRVQAQPRDPALKGQRDAQLAADRRLARKAQAGGQASPNVQPGKTAVAGPKEKLDPVNQVAQLRIAEGTGAGKLDGPITDIKQNGRRGIDGSYTGMVNGQKVCIKPVAEQAGWHGRQNITIGNNHGRAAAAYLVSERMNMGVPFTTIRDVPGKGLSEVNLWASNTAGFPWGRPGGVTQQHALYDAIIGNTDRHGGNMITIGGKVIPLDHGLAFPDKKGGTGGNYQWLNHHGNKPLDSESKRILSDFVKNEKAIRAELEPLVGKGAVNLMYGRVNYMNKTGRVLTSDHLYGFKLGHERGVVVPSMTISKPLRAGAAQLRPVVGLRAGGMAIGRGGRGRPAGPATRAMRKRGEFKQRQEPRIVPREKRQQVADAKALIFQKGLPDRARLAGVKTFNRGNIRVNRRGHVGWWVQQPNGNWRWVDLNPRRPSTPIGNNIGQIPPVVP